MTFHEENALCEQTIDRLLFTDLRRLDDLAHEIRGVVNQASDIPRPIFDDRSQCRLHVVVHPLDVGNSSTAR